ncbi:MAG: hypothetical protein F6J97_15310, partial [Leptolyngbya sp. SIO4C1]|nr:hypothetical protein [Leptolyngbya sp. SIO4C1]
MNNENICFVIAPIGKPESDTYRRSKQILNHIIRPTVKLKGFTAVRADEISEPGLISTQVTQYIIDAPLVIADLTGHNANVFYELAIRHAIRKPLIQLIDENDQLPFDVVNTRTIKINHNDLDSVEAAKEQIIAQIEASTQNNLRVDNPISVAID